MERFNAVFPDGGPRTSAGSVSEGELRAEFARGLTRSGEPIVEFELRYLERDPQASYFAYDMLTFDRAFRRAAREARDGMPRGPVAPRRRRHPLGIASGLVVGESHHSDFSFVLQVPSDVYRFVLSDPVEFALRVFELGGAAGLLGRVFLRLSRAGADQVTEVPIEDPDAPDTGDLGVPEEPDAVADDPLPDEEAEQPIRRARLGHERIQRIILPDGTRFETIDRTWL